MADETQTPAQHTAAAPPPPQAHAATGREEGSAAITWASVLGPVRYSPDDPPDGNGTGGGGSKGALSVAGA